MSSTGCEIVFLRYWGSHFKSVEQVAQFAKLFAPLIQRGWACHLVVEREPEDGSWTAKLLQMGVRLICVARATGHIDFKCIRRVYSLCRRIRCSIFVCDNLHTSPLLGALAARVPVRVWNKRAMNAHFELCEAPGFRARLAPSTRISCVAATRIVAVSSAVKSELIELGVRDAKVVVRNNPRTYGDKLRVVNRASARLRFGFAQDDIVITSVGRSEPVKGWDLLIPAFARAAKASPRARLVLVGDTRVASNDRYHDSLNRLVVENRLERRLQFTGPVSPEDVAELLAASDVFAMPSRSEGFCRALVEAMESGLPCVATRVGVAEEVVEHGVNGYLVSRNNVVELADALHAILADDGKRLQMARKVKIPSFIRSEEERAEQLAQDFESWLGHRHRSRKKVQA